MMKHLGRLVVRKGKTVGLFLPFAKDIPPGIYELNEIMGEMTVRYHGKQAMPDARYNGLTPDGLLAEIATAAMTEEEYAGCCK